MATLLNAPHNRSVILIVDMGSHKTIRTVDADEAKVDLLKLLKFVSAGISANVLVRYGQLLFPTGQLAL